jgi:uncharacterized repeat protein (TIGR02543 family)
MANPGSGYSFTDWSGGPSGSANPVTIVMNGDKTITANFSVYAGAVTYDDRDANIVYKVGVWSQLIYPGIGPYNNTIHRSTTVGDTATLTFSGIKVKLIYTRADTSSLIQTVIDGDTPAIWDANLASTQWQAIWESQTLTNGPHTITVTHLSGATMDVDAFTIVGLVCRTLTLRVDDISTGSAPTASPANTTGCSSGQYSADETITLTANPGTGYRLDHWVGTNSSSSNILTMLDIDTTVTAYYIPDCYTLIPVTYPPSSGSSISVSPNSNCVGGKYYKGTIVQLMATPATGWTFAKWTGGLTGSDNPGSVTVQGNTSVTANFKPPLSVSKTGTGSGTVTSVPNGIDCGTTCSINFDYNTPVTLTAIPVSGSTFTGWSGAGCTGTGTCIVTMSAAKSVTANFTTP